MFTEKQQTEYILSRLEQEQTRLEKEKLNLSSSFGSGAESEVYLSKDKNELYKVPKNKEFDNSLIRSFYIGQKLNLLHYLVPNFVQTRKLHLKSNGEESFFVAYEYVKGVSLEKMLADNILDFSQFLNLFVQILFALEIAQRYCSFCHYDLHLGNIILKTIEKPYTYTLVFDQYRYDITAEKYIPILIDFGFASSIIDNKSFGTHSFQDCGILSRPIQGADMYKLLFHSYVGSKGSLQKQIGELFLFYGTYDPYRMLLTSRKDWIEFSKEYLKKIVKSRIATYTPLEMIFWILKSSNLVSVQKNNRDILHPLPAGIEIKNFSSKSLIVSTYLEKLGMKKRKVSPVFDLKMLNNYTDIVVPNEIAIRDEINNILGQRNKKLKIKNLQRANLFLTELTPFLHFYYMIKECNLNQTFEKFVTEFPCSKQYQVYHNLSFIVDKTNRWYNSIHI